MSVNILTPTNQLRRALGLRSLDIRSSLLKNTLFRQYQYIGMYLLNTKTLECLFVYAF